eukprot:jgi/Bigna1/87080/estExt_fgenesh1_pg.C_160184
MFVTAESSKLKEGSSSAVYVYRLTADGKLGSWLGTEFEGIVAKFKYIKPKNLVCRYLWTKDSDMLKGSIQTLKIDDQEISRLAALAKTAGVPGLESWVSKNEGAGEGQSKHDGGGGGGGGSGGEAFNKLCEPVQITAGAGMEVIKAITRFSTKQQQRPRLASAPVAAKTRNATKKTNSTSFGAKRRLLKQLLQHQHRQKYDSGDATTRMWSLVPEPIFVNFETAAVATREEGKKRKKKKSNLPNVFGGGGKKRMNRAFRKWVAVQEWRRLSLTVKSPSSLLTKETKNHPLVEGIRLKPSYLRLMRLSSFARPMDTYVVIKPCVYVKPSQQHILRHLNNSNKHGLVQVSENVCFPVKRQTERPTWNCCRRVLLPELSRQFKIGMDTVLFFQVFAKSNLMGDQEIARARVPLKDIRQDEKLMSIPLVLKSPSEGERVAMILQRARVPPRHKTVFFISKRPNVLTLVADAREKRNLGGRDTQGQALGQEIIDRALNELQRQFKNTPQKEVPEEIKRVGININDCTQIWWNSNAESADAFNERLDNLAKHLGYDALRPNMMMIHEVNVDSGYVTFALHQGFLQEVYMQGRSRQPTRALRKPPTRLAL